jgi:hypothetical protein
MRYPRHKPTSSTTPSKATPFVVVFVVVVAVDVAEATDGASKLTTTTAAQSMAGNKAIALPYPSRTGNQEGEEWIMQWRKRNGKMLG